MILCALSIILKFFKHRILESRTVFLSSGSWVPAHVGVNSTTGDVVSNPGGGEIFRAHLDRPWGPTSLLYKGHWVFPGGKAAGTWRSPPTPSSAEVKERVELYLYSPIGPLWPFLG